MRRRGKQTESLSDDERQASRDLGQLAYLWRFVRPYGRQVTGAFAAVEKAYPGARVTFVYADVHLGATE